MLRNCPNCKQLIEGQTAVCPHCRQPLPRLVSVQIERSHTTVPYRSAWDKFRNKPVIFKQIRGIYFAGLAAMILGLFSGGWQLVIVGLIIGLIGLAFMALSVIDIKRGAEQPTKLLRDHKSNQASDWLEALAKKDRKR